MVPQSSLLQKKGWSFHSEPLQRKWKRCQRLKKSKAIRLMSPRPGPPTPWCLLLGSSQLLTWRSSGCLHKHPRMMTHWATNPRHRKPYKTNCPACWFLPIGMNRLREQNPTCSFWRAANFSQAECMKIFAKKKKRSSSLKQTKTYQKVSEGSPWRPYSHTT